MWLHCTCVFILSQAGGAEESRSEALWDTTAKNGGPSDRQRGKQTDRTWYLKAELPGPTHHCGLVSQNLDGDSVNKQPLCPCDITSVCLFEGIQKLFRLSGPLVRILDTTCEAVALFIAFIHCHDLRVHHSGSDHLRIKYLLSQLSREPIMGMHFAMNYIKAKSSSIT